jgi:hypothetical protein
MVRLSGTRESYSSIALVDAGARMTLIDKSLAERVGVQFTGRVVNFVSVSGHVVKALEAVIPELEIEGRGVEVRGRSGRGSAGES